MTIFKCGSYALRFLTKDDHGEKNVEKSGVQRRTVRKVPGWEILELSGILTVSEMWADHLTARLAAL